MLKLFTDKTFLTEAHRKSVFPLLFDLHYVKNNDLSDFYKLVDRVSDCDVVVFPMDYGVFYKHQEAFSKLNKEAKHHKKPIWIYTAGDFGFTVHIPNSYVFRFGGFHSKLDANTFVMPSFINDPYQTVLKQPFSVVPTATEPHIGFVGHAKAGFVKYIKSYLSHLKLKFKGLFKLRFFDRQVFYPSGIKRAHYLNALKNSKQLHTDFIFRDTYRAGIQNPKSKQETTQEFYDNMFSNLYTFCMRGVGNFSVRFYETLAVGRIPVLLNTDCRLPLSDSVDWEKHVIIVDASKKESLEAQILQFHTSKSEEEIKAIQKNNRLLWETHLERPAYFMKVHNMFVNKLMNHA